jgi:hypothetical protein
LAAQTVEFQEGHLLAYVWSWHIINGRLWNIKYAFEPFLFGSLAKSNPRQNCDLSGDGIAGKRGEFESTIQGIPLVLCIISILNDHVAVVPERTVVDYFSLLLNIAGSQLDPPRGEKKFPVC